MTMQSQLQRGREGVVGSHAVGCPPPMPLKSTGTTAAARLCLSIAVEGRNVDAGPGLTRLGSGHFSPTDSLHPAAATGVNTPWRRNVVRVATARRRGRPRYASAVPPSSRRPDSARAPLKPTLHQAGLPRFAVVSMVPGSGTTLMCHCTPYVLLITSCPSWS
jgi:hypothetical protein